MIYKYGSHAHQNNEVALTVAKRVVESERGERLSTIITHTLEGFLKADTQAELTAEIVALEKAYEKNGVSAGLFYDNGSTKTPHYIDKNSSFGGMRVIEGPSYPDGTGAEYATYRTYRIVLQAEVAEAEENVTDFREKVTFSGGGPKIVFQQPIIGPPIRSKWRSKLHTWPFKRGRQPVFRHGQHRPRRCGPVRWLKTL